MLKPHFRFPEQSLSLSQSPSPAPQGFELEQHPQVSATDVPLQIHLGIIGLPKIIQFYNHLNYEHSTKQVVWYDHEKSLFKLFNILEYIIGLPEIIQFHNHINYEHSINQVVWYDHENPLFKHFQRLFFSASMMFLPIPLHIFSYLAQCNNLLLD